jgi:hypothetical protein
MKQLWSSLSYYVNIFMEELRKTTKKKSPVRTVDDPAAIRKTDLLKYVRIITDGAIFLDCNLLLVSNFLYALNILNSQR